MVIEVTTELKDTDTKQRSLLTVAFDHMLNIPTQYMVTN